MLYLSRHSSCPLWQGYKDPELPWTGLQFSCLNVLRIYCKIFDKQDVFRMILRKTCQSCKCTRDSHGSYHKEWTTLIGKLGLLPDFAFANKAEPLLEVGGKGELLRQLPRQDLAAEHCKHLQPHQKPSFEDFVVARNEIALDLGYAKESCGREKGCPSCQLPMRAGELGIVATRLGDDVMFHPPCFTCTTCAEPLADLAYCALEGKPYCERHYAEIHKPRCAACDEDDPNVKESILLEHIMRRLETITVKPEALGISGKTPLEYS